MKQRVRAQISLREYVLINWHTSSDTHHCTSAKINFGSTLLTLTSRQLAVVELKGVVTFAWDEAIVLVIWRTITALCTGINKNGKYTLVRWYFKSRQDRPIISKRLLILWINKIDIYKSKHSSGPPHAPYSSTILATARPRKLSAQLHTHHRAMAVWAHAFWTIHFPVARI